MNGTDTSDKWHWSRRSNLLFEILLTRTPCKMQHVVYDMFTFYTRMTTTKHTWLQGPPQEFFHERSVTRGHDERGAYNGGLGRNPKRCPGPVPLAGEAPEAKSFGAFVRLKEGPQLYCQYAKPSKYGVDSQ